MKMAPRNESLPSIDAEPVPPTPSRERPFGEDRRPCPDCWGWPCVCDRLIERRLARRFGRRPPWWKRILRWGWR